MSLPVPEELLPPFLRQSDKVIYSDGNLHGSLQWLNFCQICKAIRDQKGMVYDIEVQRCTTCSETFTITENNEKENGCPQCFECPCCAQALVIRTTILPPSVPLTEAEEKPVQEKRFYLVCQTCRWSSRTAGIPDATRLPSITSPWRFTPEGTGEPRDEVAVLADYYRGLSVTDKSISSSSSKATQKSKRYRGPSYSSFVADKYKLVSVAQKKLASVLGATPPADIVVLEARLPKVNFLGNDEVPECPEEDLIKFVSMDEAEKKLPLRQRLRFPGQQPTVVGALFPRNKALSSKAVWRCRTCQHVMVKMDYLAQSFKFKLISSAPLLVPTIQPCKPKLTLGTISDFVVVISNPLSHDVHMTFSLPGKNEPVPAWISGALAEDLTLPGGAVVLLNRACAADEKGGGGATDSLAGEDSSMIAFRKLYTVGLRFSCVPTSAESDNWVSFHIRYDFQETQATVFNPEKQGDSGSADGARETTTTWLDFRVDMNLGRTD